MDRTFLEYWSNLQFQSWADVAAYYDPRFRKFVGTVPLINAKKEAASIYPFAEAGNRQIQSNQGVSTVYFTVRLEDGTKELASTTWRKVGGNWQIVYDSRLDAELTQLAQEKAQLAESGAGTTEPSSQPLSQKAVRAGKAAGQVQSRFLEQELLLNHR